VRNTVFGLRLGRTPWLLDEAKEVEVLHHTTQSETKYGSRSTTWYRVRVAKLEVARDFTDDRGMEQALALARRVADHLGLPLVEKKETLSGRPIEPAPPAPMADKPPVVERSTEEE
jgi:hypothetical protein